MTIQEVIDAIATLKKQGNSDDDIAMSFYLMYVDEKINKNQFKALLGVLNYSLPNSFWKMKRAEQIKFFMKEHK